MYSDIKLTGVLQREAARMLVLAWLNEAIEIRHGEAETLTQIFKPDDFGNVFNTLEWEHIAAVEVTIEPVRKAQKETDKENQENLADDLASQWIQQYTKIGMDSNAYRALVRAFLVAQRGGQQ